MPNLCNTCGKPVVGYRTVKGNRVPRHATDELNKECVRIFNSALAAKRARNPIKENDGRLR